MKKNADGKSYTVSRWAVVQWLVTVLALLAGVIPSARYVRELFFGGIAHMRDWSWIEYVLMLLMLGCPVAATVALIKCDEFLRAC